MKFFYQVLSTPTSDTPGSTVVLNFPNRRYIFGHLGEGTQRVFIENGFTLSYLNDLFVTGQSNWANYGGTLGMILTLASSRTTGLNGIEDDRSRKTGKQEAALSRVSIHGGKNITHMLATARRFIFRKSLPISVKEHDRESLARAQQDAATGGTDPFKTPTFVDENISVWAMALKASYGSRFEGRAGFKSPRKRSLNEFEEREVAQSESAATVNSFDKDQMLREHIVKDMFDSDWRLDALYEENLYEVKLPATMFVRNPETKDLARYTGPLPGDSGHVPNIKVLVRRPWPAATVERLPPTTPSSESICYFVRNHDQRGTFDPQKAIALGVPKGPAFAQLIKGNNYTTETGTVVTSDMVLGPIRRGRTVAFIDVPTTFHIDDLLARPEWQSPMLTETLASIFWILGPGVSEDQRLLDFIAGLQNCEHIVSSPDVCPDRLTLASAAKSALRLAKINNDSFRIPYHDNVTCPQPGIWPPGRIAVKTSVTKKPRWTTSEPGLLLDIEPKFGINHSAVIPPLDTGEYFARIPKAVEQRLKVIRKTLTKHDVISGFMHLREGLPPLARESEVITLGTGSSSPSKYRNVSATLLHVPGKGYYLLDCGENTLGQLKRTYPPEQFREVMQNLRMILISHLHADHHLGVVSVIKEWYKVNYNITSGASSDNLAEILKEKRLFVVGENMFIEYLEEFAGVEDYGFNKLVPLAVVPRTQDQPSASFVFRHAQPNGTVLENGPSPTYMRFDDEGNFLAPLLRAATGLENINAVLVNHCRNAMALTLEWEDGFKVAYSGDCRPSKSFAEIGKDSTLLIHEATFQDDLRGQAIAKKHSTTSEALMVGNWMNAKLVLLTHFSQRYAKISRLAESNRKSVSRQNDREARAAYKNRKDASDVPNNEGSDSDAASTDVPSVYSDDIRQPTRPVCIAFDYMGVKLRDFPIAQMFMPAFEKLIERLEQASEEETAVVREKAQAALDAKRAKMGKKKLPSPNSPQQQQQQAASSSTAPKKSAWSASESESGWSSDEGEQISRG